MGMRHGILALSLLLSGCGIFGFLSGSQVEELRRQRERWEALEIRSYDYEHQKGCYCVPEINQRVRVEVRNGVVARTVNVASGEEISHPQITWPTIDELFDRTEELFGTGYKLKITYDRTRHFPTEIIGDVPDAVDDEFTTTVRNFVPR
jgi:hypothetical protein